jgi:hypothetical protein
MFTKAPNRSFTIADHFLNNAGSDSWIIATSGTSAQVTSTGVVGTRANPGLVTFQSGTTTTGRGKVSSSQTILFGGGSWFLQAIVEIPTLSVVGDEFRAYVGFYDGTTGDGSDTAMFYYDRLNFGDNWLTDTATGGTHTTNTISAISAATFYRLGIEINAAATRVKFYLNGALVQTHTTNIPTGATNQTQVGIAARKTAGTTNVNMLVLDHLLLQFTHTNPLWTA